MLTADRALMRPNFKLSPLLVEQVWRAELDFSLLLSAVEPEFVDLLLFDWSEQALIFSFSIVHPILIVVEEDVREREQLVI